MAHLVTRLPHGHLMRSSLLCSPASITAAWRLPGHPLLSWLPGILLTCHLLTADQMPFRNLVIGCPSDHLAPFRLFGIISQLAFAFLIDALLAYLYPGHLAPPPPPVSW